MTELIDAIRRGDLHPSLPQELTLHGGEILRCEQLLRVLPGKRGVFKARYLGRDVLAKIFLDSASRQLARELTGYERLITAQQPTPPLIATVTTEGASALLFEFLSDAQPLFREDTAPGTTELQPLLDRLQSMYTHGVYHDDLHWGNFLWYRDTAFVIDAGAVMGTATQPLNSQEIIDNLGVLIAQFHRCDQDTIRAAIMVHPLFQQFQLSPKALATAAEAHWQQRKKTLLEKCFRNTTAHRFASRFNHIYAYRRAYFGPELESFLRNPDAMMASGRALKLGNSATVVKLTLDGRAVVIKRYNMKSFWHWLRRCWRPSRAWNSWRNAHWLELLGLHTPTPIALLEMRCGPLRRRAYYVCEFTEGEVLADAFSHQEPQAAELAELETYFTVAARDHLIHGDMKATNFLWHDTRLIILDLDAMNEIVDSRRWRTLFARDFSRFARNANIPASITTELKTLVSKLMESTIR